MSDWIVWGGGDCPVGEDVVVDYKLEGQDTVFRNTARNLQWCFEDNVISITAYRVSEEQPEIQTQSALDTQVSGNHYKKLKIQPIEYAHKNDLDFFQFSIVKYATRHKDKGAAADLRKAIHWCELALEMQYGEKR